MQTKETFANKRSNHWEVWYFREGGVRAHPEVTVSKASNSRTMSRSPARSFSSCSERSRLTASTNWKARCRGYLSKNAFSKNAFFENFPKFWRARSRLYQNEILQENMRLIALFKLYKMCTLLHRCNLKILAKNRFEKSAILNFRENLANFSNSCECCKQLPILKKNAAR